MKNFKGWTLLFIMMAISASELFSQPSAKVEAFYIHEDPVYPNLIKQYEKTAANFKEQCAKYKIQEGWKTIVVDGNRYLYISPVKNMADLDKDVFAPLFEGMGKDAYGKIFASFDECYPSHRDYVMFLQNELSFTPAGADYYADNPQYRSITVYTVAPKNIAKVREVAAKFKEMYTKAGVKTPYHVYTSGFGEPENYFLVSMPAKSAQDHQKMRDERNALVGEQGKVLYDELLQYVISVKQSEGWFRPDLSFSVEK